MLRTNLTWRLRASSVIQQYAVPLYDRLHPVREFLLTLLFWVGRLVHRFRHLIRIFVVGLLYLPFLYWSSFHAPQPTLRTIQNVAPGFFNFALAPDGFATGRALKTNTTLGCAFPGRTGSVGLMSGLFVDVDAEAIPSASHPHLHAWLLPNETHGCDGELLKNTGPEDARIMLDGSGERTRGISYNDADEKARYIAFRKWVGGELSAETRFRYPRASVVEKNWMPFQLEDDVADDTIRLSYTLHPTHRVIRCGNKDGVCHDEWETATNFWPYSEILGFLRPGSAPIRISSDEMLAISHVSGYYAVTAKYFRGFYPAGIQYYTLFYTIETRPPFRIMRMSRPIKFFPDHRVEYPMSAFLKTSPLTSKKTLVVTWGLSDSTNVVGFLDWQDVDWLMRWNRVDVIRLSLYGIFSVLYVILGNQLFTVPVAAFVSRVQCWKKRAVKPRD